MAWKWRLSDETKHAFGTLLSALEDERVDLTDQWAARSTRWRDGEEGVAVEGWLNDLTDLIDEMQNFETEVPQ